MTRPAMPWAALHDVGTCSYSHVDQEAPLAPHPALSALTILQLVMQRVLVLHMQVQNLRLDELELASLRGDVQEVSCSLNFESQVGSRWWTALGRTASHLGP